MMSRASMQRGVIATVARATISKPAVVAAAAVPSVRAFAAAPAAAAAAGSKRFPGPLTQNQHTAHMTAAVGQLSSVVAEKALGAYIYGKDGKKYLDFCSGIGVTNLGHCHPRVSTTPHKQRASWRRKARVNRLQLSLMSAASTDASSLSPLSVYFCVCR